MYFFTFYSHVRTYDSPKNVKSINKSTSRNRRYLSKSYYKVIFKTSIDWFQHSFHFSNTLYRYLFIAVIIYLRREQFTLQNRDSVSPWDLQLVKWSPVGHSLAIVDHNNIYYIQDVNNLTSTVQLTFTGGSELYNGIPDWVYEGKYVFRMYFTHNVHRLVKMNIGKETSPILIIATLKLNTRNFKFHHQSYNKCINNIEYEKIWGMIFCIHIKQIL